MAGSAQGGGQQRQPGEPSLQWQQRQRPPGMQARLRCTRMLPDSLEYSQIRARVTQRVQAAAASDGRTTDATFPSSACACAFYTLASHGRMQCYGCGKSSHVLELVVLVSIVICIAWRVAAGSGQIRRWPGAAGPRWHAAAGQGAGHGAGRGERHGRLPSDADARYVKNLHIYTFTCLRAGPIITPLVTASGSTARARS